MIAPSRTPNDAPPGGAQAAADTNGARPTPTELLARLHTQWKRYWMAQRDLLGLRLRTVAVLAIALSLGLVAITTVVVTSVVLLLVGAAGALAHLLDLPVWGGQLAASLTILVGGSMLAYGLMFLLRRGSLKRTVARYEHCGSLQPANRSHVDSEGLGAAH
ncbi:MAG: hypothetical protein JNG90_19765 [Planctomycetaceae bacterium]|nr:hypothetical protein [Planctomycetaceae bacterium]